MTTTHNLIHPWTYEGHSYDEVTLRPADAEDFIAAHKAAVERGVMSHDGKTFLPCPITHGKVLLSRCIVALDGRHATVTEEMMERIGVADFEALLETFATDEEYSLNVLREIIGTPDVASATRH